MPRGSALTFDDHITAEHYREMFAAANPLNAKWAVWAITAFLAALCIALAGAMGAFFYAVVRVVMKKGPAGVVAEPTTLLLIGAGLLLTALALFVMVYKCRTLRLVWKVKSGPDISDMDLREGLNLGPARYILSDQGIRVEMPLDTEEIKWSAFVHFRETANGIMLMFNRTNGVVMPTGQLVAAGDYDAACDIVSSQLKKAA
ncbi:MAG: YcxB family protein [Alphaproteobacteria bacterium]|nr:YcxB family protein [Alphaproteobacteria bacterium]